jgi:hypothetical protein
MKDKNESNKADNKSYFAVSRHKRRRTILKIAIPVAAAAIVLGIVFGMQVSEQGIGSQMVMHIHPQLTVKVDGKPITVPQNVGIDKPLWKNHSLDKYGMQGMAPLHTHDATGTMHVESTVNRDYTLGEFLNIWGIDLNGKTVKVTADGQPIPDWRNHILKDREQINLGMLAISTNDNIQCDIYYQAEGA